MVWAGVHHEWAPGVRGHAGTAHTTVHHVERARSAMPSKTSATSAKAVRAAGKAAPGRKKGSGKGKGTRQRQIPWLAIGAAAVIIALIGALAYNLVPKYQ